jgi:N-dimethylarginine dimethylaminohydrolase
MIFVESEIRKQLTKFGVAVKKALLEKHLTSKDIIEQLNKEGIDIHKVAFSNLLYGIGATSNRAIVERIAVILGI